MILLFWGFSRKGRLLKVSRAAMDYKMLINIATGITFAGAIYILLVYKLTEYMRVTDYIIFGMLTVLIKWQQEKFRKIAKEKEIELRNTYEEVHKQLIETIRKKQHDFNNQISAVYFSSKRAGIEHIICATTPKITNKIKLTFAMRIEHLNLTSS